jgi:dihydroorotate dehydrogenase
VRRLPSGPGGILFGRTLTSSLGIAAGPLLNSKWVEAYARLGFDVLTYATVRSSYRAAHGLPNIRHVDNRDQAAVVARATNSGGTTIAVSLGEPSMEPDIWRKDVRRAKERIGSGQVLIVSVIGTPTPGGDAEALIGDYTQCASWAAESGADAVEIHLATPDPFVEQAQMIYENVPLAARILHRVRTTVAVPILAKLGPFKTPRLLHETATRLAAWAHGYVLVHGINRRVFDEKGSPAFEGRVGSALTSWALRPSRSLRGRSPRCWRGARPARGTGPFSRSAASRPSSARRDVLREGADAVLVATAALYDPLFATRFRQIRTAEVA